MLKLKQISTTILIYIELKVKDGLKQFTINWYSWKLVRLIQNFYTQNVWQEFHITVFLKQVRTLFPNLWQEEESGLS